LKGYANKANVMAEYIQLRIKKIITEAVDAITITFEEITGAGIEYQAGQFLTLPIKIGNKEHRRSYSLCSTPNIDSNPSITIKRVVNGEVSRFLMDHLKEGDIINALPPAGRFTLETSPENQRDIFLIGAGSGITPLFSHLKNLLKNESKSRIILIDCNKNEHHILYYLQLKQLQEEYSERLEIIHLLSEPGEKFKNLRGRLNIEQLEKLVEKRLRFNRQEAKFMVCGPFSFMRMVRMTLIYMGFEEDQIRKENFVSKTISTESAPALDLSDQTVKLVVNKKEIALKVRSGKTILDEALANGISLPYSCKAGVCSSCIGRCKTGKVHMVNNEVLTEKEVYEGFVLTCVAYPLSEDVKIEFK
jgi:ring-1,2-phenylacetyl-CoA epoxidase subunit PaaE